MAKRSNQKQDLVPTWLAVAVVIIGGFAVSLPMYSAFVLFGIPTNGPAVGSTSIAGAQYAVGPTSSTPVIRSFCSDSDGGPNLAVQGTCTGSGAPKTDYCYSSTHLVEFQCGAGKCVKNLYNCLNYGFSGCLNGACVLGGTGGNNTSHLECVALSCTQISGAGANLCNTDADCKHLACVGSSCSYVAGGGANLCNTNADCGNNSNQTHLACVGLTCTTVSGAGANLCATNADCDNSTNQSHLECVSNTCTQVSGSGSDTCSPIGSSCNNSSLPDLTVISLTSSNGNKTGNVTNVTLTATVKNIGTVGASSSTTRFTVIGVGSNDVFTTSLAAGAQTTIWTSFLLNTGTYNSSATADIFNVVGESDETNNVRTLTFVV